MRRRPPALNACWRGEHTRSSVRFGGERSESGRGTGRLAGAVRREWSIFTALTKWGSKAALPSRSLRRQRTSPPPAQVAPLPRRWRSGRTSGPFRSRPDGRRGLHGRALRRHSQDSLECCARPAFVDCHRLRCGSATRSSWRKCRSHEVILRIGRSGASGQRLCVGRRRRPKRRSDAVSVASGPARGRPPPSRPPAAAPLRASRSAARTPRRAPLLQRRTRTGPQP